jgi:hypothetical protein
MLAIAVIDLTGGWSNGQLGFLCDYGSAWCDCFCHHTISLIDRADAKRAEYIIYNPNSFCNEHCKIYEEVNSKYKDPDDAWNELDSENNCWKCPIFLAQDIIEEKERKKKK